MAPVTRVPLFLLLDLKYVLECQHLKNPLFATFERKCVCLFRKIKRDTEPYRIRREDQTRENGG